MIVKSQNVEIIFLWFINRLLVQPIFDLLLKQPFAISDLNFMVSFASCMKVQRTGLFNKKNQMLLEKQLILPSAVNVTDLIYIKERHDCECHANTQLLSLFKTLT